MHDSVAKSGPNGTPKRLPQRPLRGARPLRVHWLADCAPRRRRTPPRARTEPRICAQPIFRLVRRLQACIKKSSRTRRPPRTQGQSHSVMSRPASSFCHRHSWRVRTRVDRGRPAALLRDLRPSPGGLARRGPEINSTPLASPGTVAGLFSLRGAREIRVRSPRRFPG